MIFEKDIYRKYNSFAPEIFDLGCWGAAAWAVGRWWRDGKKKKKIYTENKMKEKSNVAGDNGGKGEWRRAVFEIQGGIVCRRLQWKEA